MALEAQVNATHEVGALVAVHQVLGRLVLGKHGYVLDVELQTGTLQRHLLQPSIGQAVAQREVLEANVAGADHVDVGIAVDVVGIAAEEGVVAVEQARDAGVGFVAGLHPAVGNVGIETSTDVGLVAPDG